MYNIDYKVSPSIQSKHLQLELLVNPYLGTVYYTTDGTEPTNHSSAYTAPIELTQDMVVKSALYKNGDLKGKITTRSYQINKATNKQIVFKNPPSKSYNFGGGFTLVNGVVATLPRVNNQWLAWNDADLEATIHLEKEQEINSIQIGFLNEELNWIYLPKEIEFLYSTDGVNFKSIETINANKIKDNRFALITPKSLKATYIKIIAKRFGAIPSGKPGAGENAWLFCDEILIK